MTKTVIDKANAKGSVTRTTATDKTDKKNKIVFSNLNKKQKDMLSTAGLGLAGLFAGGGIYAVMGFADDPVNPTPPPSPVPDPSPTPTPVVPDEIIIYTNAPVAHNITDDMPFSEAFKTARAEVGEGGVFEWKGELYNTYTKEEWEAMTEEEQLEFGQSVANRSDVVVNEIDTDEEIEILEDNVEIVNEDDDNDEEFEEVTVDEPQGEEYVINQEDVFAYQDVNGDGNADLYLIDVNEDGHLDIVADTNSDNVADAIEIHDGDIEIELGIEQNNNHIDNTNDDVEIDNNDIANVDDDFDPNFDVDDYA